jgi:transcriptional regulator with XRE-family HTH domain
MSSTLTAIRIDRLRELREKRGWSQRELGRRCGIGDSQINKYELGAIDPSAKYLGIMADQLEVSADYLLGRTNDPHFIVTEDSLAGEERAILEAYRREGWAGVARLLAEHLAK